MRAFPRAEKCRAAAIPICILVGMATSERHIRLLASTTVTAKSFIDFQPHVSRSCGHSILLSLGSSRPVTHQEEGTPVVLRVKSYG
ncbi:hypothetical protein PAHAL_1G286900 [Panicum hallii]|uniref:Uncharacterized protein n=1 Tax=Panicum hallii TaxID=206008 RepID=A0A2T8KWM1_9POAL|nr:hypothetical protein PAHAL_1G286900 [Panicum hallii]